VSVQAPDGGTLTAEGRSPGATPVRDKEALRYRLTGAGVYVVNVVINVQVVGHGAQTATYQRTGTLKASTEAMTPGS
jgi:hypothetical protein